MFRTLRILRKKNKLRKRSQTTLSKIKIKALKTKLKALKTKPRTMI